MSVSCSELLLVAISSDTLWRELYTHCRIHCVGPIKTLQYSTSLPETMTFTVLTSWFGPWSRKWVLGPWKCSCRADCQIAVSSCNWSNALYFISKKFFKKKAGERRNYCATAPLHHDLWTPEYISYTCKLWFIANQMWDIKDKSKTRSCISLRLPS